MCLSIRINLRLMYLCAILSSIDLGMSTSEHSNDWDKILTTWLLFHGEDGIGKNTMVKAIAQTFNIRVL